MIHYLKKTDNIVFYLSKLADKLFEKVSYIYIEM